MSVHELESAPPLVKFTHNVNTSILMAQKYICVILPILNSTLTMRYNDETAQIVTDSS